MSLVDTAKYMHKSSLDCALGILTSDEFAEKGEHVIRGRSVLSGVTGPGKKKYLRSDLQKVVIDSVYALRIWGEMEYVKSMEEKYGVDLDESMLRVVLKELKKESPPEYEKRQ
jgi:transposase